MTGEVFAQYDAESSVLRQIIEATPTAMVMVDETGRITLVNSRTERLFGRSRDELFSMDVSALFAERFRPSESEFRAIFLDENGVDDDEVRTDWMGLHSNGREFPVEVGLNRICIAGHPYVLASVVDISVRLEAQSVDRAQRSDQLRRSIVDSLPFTVIATDLDGTILTVNPAAEQFLGFSRDELVGSPMERLREDGDAYRSLTKVGGVGVAEREIDFARKDGTLVAVSEVITLIRDDNGDVSGLVSAAYDITRRREAEAFVRHMAHFDYLTDLPNRTKLFERLDDAIRNARRTGRRVAVAMIDIDHFKRVNDSLGHHVGDELLIAMADRLRSQMGDEDTVARLDGDEFVLVFAGVNNQVEVEERITAVLESIPDPIMCHGHELMVTASMGVVMCPDGGRDATTLLKHADTAMYHAKTPSRQTFQWFQDSMLDETNDKLEMATALRHALDRDEIEVAYQIQVSLLTGEVVGIEALARWQAEDGSYVPPERFIQVAEDNGLIIRLGEWVLRRACLDAVKISDATGVPLTLAVNVSPPQFNDKDWLKVLQSALDDSHLPADRLEVEITEGIFMEDPLSVVDVMHTVRALGASIVVDDFGTGFSSLAYLTRFPIDTIKIDRSFVNGVVINAADAAIVDAIIVMAHTLGMTVVGEGVETEAQERYLRERGCDVGQGYLYSEAVWADEVAAAIHG